MSRRPLLENDSLELLLDTICNTFGGILFLAVLVIILLQRADQILRPLLAKQVDTTASSQSPSDSERRQAELRSLERAFREYQITLAGLETEQSAEIAQQVVRMRSRVAELSTRRMKYAHQYAELSQRATELEQRRQQTVSAVARVTKEVTSLEGQLESEQKNRIRTADLPMLRQTEKREFPVILRFGRLYLPFDADTSLATRRSNLDEFVVIDDSGPVFRVTPKPYAGLPVDGSDHFIDSLRRKLTSLDCNSEYLAIGVWEDSFEQFHRLREAIVRLGFEYRLVPVSSGEFIQESRIKEALVQ